MALASETTLSMVRTQCLDIVLTHASVAETTLEGWVHELTKSSDWVQEHTRYPLQFDSDREEAHFRFVLHGLLFGSGYERILQQAAGRSPKEAIQYGLLGMVFGGNGVKRDSLTAMSELQVATDFNLEIKTEKAIGPNTPIYAEADSDLRPFVKLLHSAIEEMGTKLWELDCTDFEDFVRKHCHTDSRSAGSLVFALQKFFPCFRDNALHDGKPVHFLNKAQALAIDLYQRFGSSHPVYGFQDITQLIVPVGGPVLKFCLGAQWVVPSADLQTKLDDGVDIGSGTMEEVELRAACVQAIDTLVEVANAKVQAGSSPGFPLTQAGVYCFIQYHLHQGSFDNPQPVVLGTQAY
eukprot:NODE_771_length_1204_cov_104.801300_g731_i0.p1 GENE.NODE_771_length_1204_cov_104.801300_g731_i0~~NODE_771_length_1204_cov_104.801300_g731_i0.p1  ORF type:complete len:376 (+),score=57.85 NODE_771_length_1204_cov_104.801300_g731_i0:77-1129(+)